MPGYKGHLMGGVVVYGVLIYFLRPLNPTVSTLAEWFLCALAGSLFPDVDTKSKGQKYFYSMLCIILAVLFFCGRFKLIAIISSCCFLPLLVNHRGLFHRVWFLVGLPAGLAYLGCACIPGCADALMYDALFFIAGALSHVWLDVGFKRMFRW